MSLPSVAGSPDHEPRCEQKARRALRRRRLRDQKSPAGHDRYSDQVQHDEANLGDQSERKARSTRQIA
jgi:hypothetical protein